MSLDAILQKIKTDAETEIKQIQKDGQKRLSESAKEKKRELLSLQRDFEEKLAKKKEKFLESARNDADFRAKNEILKKKQELIAEIYEKTAKKIINSPEYYSALMVSLIEKLPKNADGQIYCAKKDESLIKNILKKQGFSREVKNEKFEDAGGFIFKTKFMEIDNTLNALIKQIKEKTLVEIGKILFY